MIFCRDSLEVPNILPIFAASKIRMIYLCSIKDKNDMIATSQTTTNQKAKATTTRERVMASTVSVDEYFDELISQVHQDYAEL